MDPEEVKHVDYSKVIHAVTPLSRGDVKRGSCGDGG